MVILYIFKTFFFLLPWSVGFIRLRRAEADQNLTGKFVYQRPTKNLMTTGSHFFQVWLSDFKFRYLLIRPTSGSDVSSSSILKYINYFSIVKKFTFKVIIKCQKNTKIGPPRKCFKNFCARSKNCMYKKFSNRTFIINFI